MDITSEKVDKNSDKLDEMQASLSDFMTQMSNTVNSIQNEMIAQSSNTSCNETNFHGVLDESSMNVESEKRIKRPAPAEEYSLRDGGRKK